MHCTKKDNRFAYTNGRHVIIRSLEDPSKAELFSEHKSKVNVAKFSPNGEYVASGDDSGNVIIWGSKNQLVKLEVPVCRQVLDIAWSADGKRIVAVGDGAENLAKVFQWDTGNNIGTVAGHSKSILSCDFKPTNPLRIVTASEDLGVHYYVGAPFKFQSKFSQHTRFPNCVRFSPDGNFYVSVGSDSKIYLFDSKSGELVKEIKDDKGHSGSIYSVCWSPDNKKILTVSGDKSAKLWEVESGKLEKTFTFGKAVGDMQISCIWQDDYILTASLSGNINYLDLENPDKPKKVIQGHRMSINALAVDEKSSFAYTADNDGVICKWDLKAGSAEAFTGKGHGASISAIALTASTEFLGTVGLDDTLRVNTIKGLEFSGDAIALGGQPLAVVSGSKDSDLYVVGLAQQKLVVVRNGNAVSTLDVNYKPTALAFNPDDTELAVAGDKKVHVYTVEKDTLKEVEKLEDVHRQSVTWVAYAPNGEFLASADSDRFIYIFNKGDGKVANSGWRYHNGKVNAVAWSPSTTRVATASIDQNIIIWSDTKTFSTKAQYLIERAHLGGVKFVRFLDDNTLVSTGDDRTVRIWDLTKIPSQ